MQRKDLSNEFEREFGENLSLEEFLQQIALQSDEDGNKEQNFLEAGDMVEHHIFGRGTIEKMDTKRASCLVKFETMPQPRNVSLSYFMRKHEKLQEKQHRTETEERGSRFP